jgi:hypothetical protein
VPEEEAAVFEYIKHCVNAPYPVYFSFASAASAINLVLAHYEKRRAL